MVPLASFGNLAGFDGIFIFLVLLLLFGAKKLPELARGLGSAVREFSKAKDEIHHEMTRAAEPQRPQIEAPKYTEPQVAGSQDPHAFATAADVKAPEVVSAAHVPAQAGVFGSAEVPVTEEAQHAAPGQKS